MATTVTVNGDGDLNGKRPHRTESPKHAAESHSNFGSEADLLSQAINLMAVKAMEETRKSLLGDIEAMGDLVRGEVEQASNGQIANLAQRHEAFEKSIAQQLARFTEQTRRFDELMQSRDRYAKELGAQLAEMKTTVENRLRAVTEEQARLAQRIGQVDNGLQGLTRHFDEVSGSVETRLADLSARLLQNAESAIKFDEQAHALESRVQLLESERMDATEVRFAEFDAKLDAVTGWIHKLNPRIRELADAVAVLQCSASQQPAPAKAPGFIPAVLRLFCRV